jgi:predicted amidohydrolase
LKIACLQLNPKDNIKENYDLFLSWFHRIDFSKTQVVVIPEMFLVRCDLGNKEGWNLLGEGIFKEISDLAKKHGVYIVAGSHPERVLGIDKPFNTNTVYDPIGKLLYHYRKTHLFNLKDSSGNKIFCESDHVAKGEKPSSLFEIHVEGSTWKALSLICYDLRFPEISRLFTQDILFYPSAFTHATGIYHWNSLLKARAIENQCFVVGCNQTGFYYNNTRRNYGHSVIYDPWGDRVASLEEDEGILYATLDFEKIREVRAKVPAVYNRELNVDL